EVDDELPGDPTTAGIFGQLYDKSGNPLGSPITVSQSDPSATLFYQPAVATDGTSKFIVTWAEEVPQGGDIRSRTFDLNGSPLGNETVVTGPVDNLIDEPRVAMNRKGAYVIVWRGPTVDPGVPGVFGQRYNAAGQRAGSTFRVDSASG